MHILVATLCGTVALSTIGCMQDVEQQLNAGTDVQPSAQRESDRRVDAPASTPSMPPVQAEALPADPIEYELLEPDEHQRVHVVKVDLQDRRFRVRASTPAELGLTPSQFAERTKAIVAVNANFFAATNWQVAGPAFGEGERLRDDEGAHIARTARRSGRAIEIVEQATSIEELVARVRKTADPARPTLIVGHRGTVPQIVKALGGGDIPELHADEHNRLIVLTMLPGGKASIVTLRYGD